MDSDLEDRFDEFSLDPDALNDFVDELEGAGFERGSVFGLWYGPIPESLKPFTESEMMAIILQPGWPYFPPQIHVTGIESWHANVDNLCLWQSGDDTRKWATWRGIVDRIDDWAAEAAAGFPRHGLALDPHFYFEDRLPTSVLLDVDELLGSRPSEGQSGNLRWSQEGPGLYQVSPGNFRPGDPLPDGIDAAREVVGRWFYRDQLLTPPRDFDGFRSSLTESQKARLDADLRKVFRRLCVFVLCWRIEGGTAALIVQVVLSGTSRTAAALTPVPAGPKSRLLRAGPDASSLQQKRVLVVGVGAIGSHLAELLARSGIGQLRVVDPDNLWPANQVRHAVANAKPGTPKVEALRDKLVSFEWTSVEPSQRLHRDPRTIGALLDDVDLAVDATGDLAFAELFCRVSANYSTAAVTVSLHRGGSLARVRRQTEEDRPISTRLGHALYPMIAPSDDEIEYVGLETGCAAPVNNAPPTSVARAASLAAIVCIDVLTGRRQYPDEVIEVYKPSEPPFDKVGTVRDSDLPAVVAISETAQSTIRKAASRVAPSETGGVLVGTRVDGQTVITRAIEIPPAEPSASGFQIPEGAARTAVQEAAADDARIGYVGEWHSHPTDQGPSPIDRKMMRSLATEEDAGDPVLVIARPVAPAFIRLDVYITREGELLQAGLETVGDLPRLTS